MHEIMSYLIISICISVRTMVNNIHVCLINNFMFPFWKRFNLIHYTFIGMCH